ncbi:MAG: transcriptional repressor [Faecalimonas sp.]|nr:transcriptional repressor [Faecalimonas sp.]
MATRKYSRQRESIREYLSSTYEHPTAETVYLNVKNEYPNISLGTVYRNLNLLADTGEALKINTPYGGDRFDGHTHPHYHFCCTRCGKVLDLQLEQLDTINKVAEQAIDGIVESHTMMFYGICGDCTSKHEQLF